MGGRLQAPILCETHNNAASRVDKPFAECFAPVTNALRVVRQDGEIGVAFESIDAHGEAVRITADGEVRKKRTRVVRDAETRRFRVEGELEAVEKIAKTMKRSLSNPSSQILEGRARPARFQVNLAIDGNAHPGMIKAAVHFVHSFVAEVTAESIRILRPHIFGVVPTVENPCPFLRTFPFESPLFAVEDRPRHELTAYQGGDDTYVTFLLYGVFEFVVRIPGTVISGARRYRQYLDGAAPELFDVSAHSIAWGVPLTKEQTDAYLAHVRSRMEKIYATYQERELKELIVPCCQRAFSAHLKTGRHDTYWEFFRAEMARQAFTSEEIRFYELQLRAMTPGGIPYFADKLPLL